MFSLISEEAPKHVQHPVRSTLPWRPAPLLCKRLNVPVPSTPGEFDPARKDGLIGAKMAFTQGQAARESMSKFVPESSGARPAAKVNIQGTYYPRQNSASIGGMASCRRPTRNDQRCGAATCGLCRNTTWRRRVK